MRQHSTSDLVACTYVFEKSRRAAISHPSGWPDHVARGFAGSGYPALGRLAQGGGGARGAYGLLTQSEALERYQISEEEFHEWVRAVSEHGEAALKATALQKYRQL